MPYPETILKEWQKLDWEEQALLVAQHLRDTHSSNPFYKAKAASYQDPMEYWHRLGSSSAALIPPSWIATHFGTSSTAENSLKPGTTPNSHDQ